MRRLFAPAAVCVLLSLTACGQSAKLTPPAGQGLPVAAYGADAQADAETLLKPIPQAAPERSVELRKRSEDRAEDPFDLPPPEN